MKQINITFFLTMLMSMVGLNASAHDIEVKNADGVTIYYRFSLFNNSEVSVTYKGSTSYKTHEYTGNIVIPESITYNGKTYNVTAINGTAFYGCTGLTSVTIPNSVTSIGHEAFRGCSGLTSISIPNSVTSISYEAFEECSGLTSVNIPNSVVSIDRMAFRYCTKLTSVTIPSSVTEIWYAAFQGCSNLTSVTWNAKNCSYTLSNYQSSFILFPPSVKEFKFGNEVESIPSYLCNNMTNLTSITIPNSVVSIGLNAFAGCTGLTSVYSKIEDVFATSGTIFSDDTYSSATLYVLSGKKELYKQKSTWNRFSSIVEFSPSYKLKYLLDDVEYKEYVIDYNTSITPEPDPIKEGYSFSGWSEIPATMPNHDVEIIGSFTVNKYKLTYKVDGEEYKTYEVEYGSNITPETEPTKELYTFSGWSEIPETMPAHDVEINGTFSLNKYKLTYYVDGTEYKSYNIKYGSTLIPIDEPSKEGYTFSGWSEIPETMPANDVIVTGTFSVNKYKLTYLVDNEEYKSYDVEFGSTITPETEPSKEGYTFSGWSEIPKTMPAQNVDVYGTYSKETGVNSIYTTDNSETKFFSLEGRQLSQPQKGLNILKMSDGTTRKVVK